MVIEFAEAAMNGTLAPYHLKKKAEHLIKEMNAWDTGIEGEETLEDVPHTFEELKGKEVWIRRGNEEMGFNIVAKRDYELLRKYYTDGYVYRVSNAFKWKGKAA